jgi:hypothetical protein
MPVFYCSIAARPANSALFPSCSSILISWLYFATRSERAGAPPLIWPTPVVAGRSCFVAGPDARISLLLQAPARSDQKWVAGTHRPRRPWWFVRGASCPEGFSFSADGRRRRAGGLGFVER